MTLVEFLRARLDEDEARARGDEHAAWHVGDCGQGLYVSKCCCDVPKWVLADIDAKRQLIEAADDLVREHENTICNDEFAAGRFLGRAQGYRSELLRLLALPYGQHPGYDEEWRP